MFAVARWGSATAVTERRRFLAQLERGTPSAVYELPDGIIALWRERGSRCGGENDCGVRPGAGAAWVGHVHLGGLPTLERVLSGGSDFALAAIQPNGLLLARGRWCGRPLYYTSLPDGTVVACSRFEPLVQLLGGRPTLNPERLSAYLIARPWEDTDETIFHEIRRVRASEALLVGPSARIQKRDRGVLFAEPLLESPDDLADSLRKTIQRAIATATAPFDRVAVLVSGGLDSSLVLALAVAAARGAGRTEIEAIALTFAAPGDDRPFLRDVCHHLGIVPVQIEPEAAARDVVHLTADGMPLTWPSAPGELAMCRRAVEGGATAILTGVGGDDILGGDPACLTDEAFAGHPLRALRRAARLQTHWPTTTANRVYRFILRSALARLAPRFLRSGKAAAARVERWSFARGPARDLARDGRARRMLPEPSITGPNGRSVRTWVERATDIAEYRAQLELATGCRRIDPLFDDDVIELVARIPPQAFLANDDSRGLHRVVLRGVVPDSVQMRRDKGSLEPALTRAVALADHAYLRDLSFIRELARLGLADEQLFQAKFEQVISDRGDHPDWLGVWPALALEATLRWYEEFPRAEGGRAS